MTECRYPSSFHWFIFILQYFYTWFCRMKCTIHHLYYAFFSIFFFIIKMDMIADRYLQIIIIINKNVIWLNISMENLYNFMTIPDSATELSEIFASLSFCNIKLWTIIWNSIDSLKKVTLWYVFTNQILFMMIWIVNYLY